MSFKPEVATDRTGKFYGNALAFATREEATESAKDLMARWILVHEWRVVESDQPVNYSIIDGQLQPVQAAAKQAEFFYPSAQQGIVLQTVAMQTSAQRTPVKPSYGELAEALLHWRAVDNHLKEARKQVSQAPSREVRCVGALEQSKREAKQAINALIDRL